MSCNKGIIRATNVAVSNAGQATITVADGLITDLNTGVKIEIGLFVSIPATRECNQVRVTDGTTTLDIYCNNQYWRPCMLKCRSVLVLENYEDPDLLVIRAVKGRGAI